MRRTRVVGGNLHDKGKPLWCNPAESLLQSRVVPLAILEDRSGEGRAPLAEAREVGHVEMGSGAGVGHLCGGVHPRERLAPMTPPSAQSTGCPQPRRGPAR